MGDNSIFLLKYKDNKLMKQFKILASVLDLSLLS